jgi:ZIP family zinc transporter
MIAISFAALTFLSTMAGGLFAVRQRERLYLVMGAAAGVLLGAALFDLLPEAVELARPSPVRAAAGVAAGFAVFFALERFVHLGAAGHRAADGGDSFGSWAALGLTLHSFVDGLAVGSAFTSDIRLGVLVGVAVVAHDFGDGVSTVGVVLGSRGALRASIGWLLADAVAPLAGAALALFVHLDRPHLAIVLGFFAGSFFFLGAGHLIPEAIRAGPRGHVAATVSAGLVAMAAAAYLTR